VKRKKRPTGTATNLTKSRMRRKKKAADSISPPKEKKVRDKEKKKAILQLFSSRGNRSKREWHRRVIVGKRKKRAGLSHLQKKGEKMKGSILRHHKKKGAEGDEGNFAAK